MSYCTRLESWTEAKADELSRYGSYVMNMSGDDREKPSAHLALETDTGFVELIVWDSGEAEFAFGRSQAPTDEHHEIATAEELDSLLSRFIQEAGGLGGFGR